MKTFYAYVHAKPAAEAASGVFYVGKGSGRRCGVLVCKRSRNIHHQNVVKKYGAENILIGVVECTTEDIAFELERGLIKCLKRAGAPLTNRAEGGDISSGWKHTDETRRKISAANKGKVVSEATRTRISEARIGIRRSELLPPKVGKPHTPESKAKISAAKKGKPMSEETKQKISAAKLGRQRVRKIVNAF